MDNLFSSHEKALKRFEKSEIFFELFVNIFLYYNCKEITNKKRESPYKMAQ